MSLSALRLIVLEDHAFQRSIALYLLRQMGCAEVFDAADGAGALAILRKVGPVDIAICDLRMQGMDGLEFIREVGASGLVKSIIVCSSESLEVRRAVGQIVSLSGLYLLGDIGKPLEHEPLQHMLKQYVDRPVVNSHAPKEIELPSEAEVRRAMIAQEFIPYFQPKFNLNTGNVKAVEVLARWQHPTRGVLPPSLFMPTLEHCGLMDDLLFALLYKSMAVQRRLKTAHQSLNYAFNLQASQLSNPRLVPTIKAMLAEKSVLGSDLTFELTEDGLLELSAANLDCLVRLRMMGCSLSIGDFGAGFSSLRRLCLLPFNEIKIDAEFVHMLATEPRCESVIRSTVALGNELGLGVVVKGVETEKQRLQLLGLGCIEGQGYLHAGPMSGASLARWMNDLRCSSDHVFGERG